ncbi:MAG: carboxypeptidase regulatory-like domain-containing protein [Terracidiphilus sp.]
MTFHRNRLGILCLALITMALCMGRVALHAQTYTEGSIAGTVFDPSGAVVANAAIVIHNDGTNAEVQLTSDGSGYFKAPQLPAAVYTVTANAAGFAAFKEVNVIVLVGQTTEVTPHLLAAGTTATVEVTGEAPILNFESPDISSVLTAKAIENLPLNGGRWSDMALLTPGAVGDSNGFGLIAFRGISPILNNVEIDGADDNQAYYSEERGRTREGYSTSKYMIEEFQVNTGVYSAEFGRAAGGVINAISKSGTNGLHGIAYFSDRDNDWGAVNPYTTNTINTSTTSTPVFSTIPYKPVDWRKEWGFDAGGPLKKDKLFWFYGYAQYRRNFPGTSKAATPGSFFTLPDAALATGTCNITGSNAGYISVPTGATAASSVDQQACELAARLTAAGKSGYNTYAAGAAAYSTQLTNLLTDMGSVPRTGNEELNTPKLDWQVNSKNHVSALYHRLRWDSPGGVQTQATNTYGIDTFGTDFVKLDYGLTKLDSLITSNLSNEIRYQFGRELNDEGQQPFSAYTKQYLEGTNGITNAAAGDFSPNVPEVALDNPSSGAGIYLGSPYYSYRKALPDEHKWQVGDTAAWQKGNHNIKFGVDMVHNYDILNNTYEGNGVYTYSYIGNYFADLLDEGSSTGVCNSTSTVTSPGSSSTTNYTGKAPCGTFVQGFGSTTWNISTMDYGFFAEDHWKLTPRLTFDLGVRYDYESLPAPYSTLVAPSGSFTPYLASSNGLCSAYTGPGTCPALAAAANITNHPSDKNNIGPRIGLAYDPFGDGKTTVRLGYGLYYGRVTNGVLLNNLLNTGSPLGQYVSSSLKPNSTGAPLFPNIISAASGSAPTSYFFSSNFQNPQVHEFDLSIQRDLGHGTVAQISYMGALGRELPNAVNINLNPNANTNASGSPNGVIDSIITVSDSTGAGPLASGTTFTVPTYTNLLNSNFGAVNELFSNINSSYNAGVAEIENKTSTLLQYDVNYTWSHALDYNQNETTTTLGNGAFDPYNIDGFKRGGNYGNSAFNVENRLVAWALINSPNTQRTDWVKWVANDWSLNPVFQAQNGLPISASIGSGYPSYSAYGSSWNGAGSNYWIPAIGRDTYQLKRTMVVDMRLEKQFEKDVYGKPYHLQLMGEFFNVANHQNVTSESTTAYNFSSNSSVTSGCTATVPGQAQEECATLTYVPKTGSGVLASGFRAVTNSGSNFAYSPRQVQLSLRLDF